MGSGREQEGCAGAGADDHGAPGGTVLGSAPD